MINKKTKIICTIGPSSDKKEIIEKLIDNGMNVARINFSHGNHKENGAKLKVIKELISEGKNIGVMLDTKGPEIRVGMVQDDLIELKHGKNLKISMQEVLGTPEEISVSYPQLFDDVNIGTLIRIDDGKLGLTVIEKDYENRKLICNVLNDFKLKSRKSIGIPFTTLNMDFISKKDEEDLKFACENDFDFIAASFTRKKQDVLDVKNVLHKYGGDDIKVIAKIENHDGFNNIDEILEVADGIMVARGDLGVEVSFEEVPIIQKALIHKAKSRGKIVIVATHMLESMQYNPTPTRAEVSDVANAVYEAVDAVMLSGETAAGNFPVESVEMEARICSRVEKELDYHKLTEHRFKNALNDHSDSIAFSVASTALMNNAKLIICFSRTGNTARRISFYRPECPIFSISDVEKVKRTLSLNFGVYGLYKEKYEVSLQSFEIIAKELAREYGLKEGDNFIITGGDAIGNTNFMKIIAL